MAHPLGEPALLVPSGSDAPEPTALDELERRLLALGIASHRSPLGDDPVAVVRRELAAGTRLLVCTGSQRAVTAVVPPLLDSGADAVLGLFPGGVANDFARTFGLATNAEAAALLLASPRTVQVDVGVVECQDGTGAPVRHYVLNQASVGLDAEVLRRTQRPGGGTRAGRLAAWWTTTASYRRRATDVDMTFADWHGRPVQIRLANGQYAYDGLHVAPTALPDDGAWDVQVWEGPRHLPFTLQPQMLRGEHLPHAHVRQWRQRRVQVSSRPPSLVAADETVVGRTPASFTLRPKALRLKV